MELLIADHPCCEHCVLVVITSLHWVLVLFEDASTTLHVHVEVAGKTKSEFPNVCSCLHNSKREISKILSIYLVWDRDKHRQYQSPSQGPWPTSDSHRCAHRIRELP